jgi:pectinesterase
MMLVVRICALLSAIALANAYLLPPKGAITIGRQGQYANLSAALNDTSSDVYFVYAGNYTEGVLIQRPNVRVYGQSALPVTYLANSTSSRF